MKQNDFSLLEKAKYLSLKTLFGFLLLFGFLMHL
jgi:hypothetical protein